MKKVVYDGIYGTVSNRYGDFVKGDPVDLPDEIADILCRKPKDNTRAEFRIVEPEKPQPVKREVK